MKDYVLNQQDIKNENLDTLYWEKKLAPTKENMCRCCSRKMYLQKSINREMCLMCREKDVYKSTNTVNYPSIDSFTDMNNYLGL